MAIVAPLNLTATPGDTNIYLTWDAPIDPVPDLITYEITLADESTTWNPANALDNFRMMEGLTNGTEYGFKVRGVGQDTNGDWSDVVLATPVHVPVISAPTIVSVSPQDTTAVVTWTAPDTIEEALVDYYVVDSTLTNFWPQNDPTNLSLEVTGLTNDTPISFVVRADGATTTGDYSAPSDTVTPTHVPGISAPTITSAVPGDGKVTLTWTEPDIEDVAVTSWTVTPSTDFGNSTTWTQPDPAVMSLEIDGLNNDQPYSFLVRGEGDGVVGAWSTPSDTATPTGPVGVVIMGVTLPLHADPNWDVPLTAILQTIESRLEGQGGSGEGGAVTTATVRVEAGTGAESPVLADGSNDQRGAVMFGTGTGAIPGPMVDIVFATPLETIPFVIVGSYKVGTVPFATNITIAGFSIGVPYPTDDLINTHYFASWVVVQ